MRIVELLLGAGAKPRDLDRWLLKDHDTHIVQIVELLLDAGAVPDGDSVHDALYGDTPHTVRIVQLLLDAGADASIKDEWGQSPADRVGRHSPLWDTEVARRLEAAAGEGR